MTEYVITPQNGFRTIYGVLDADTDHDAGMSVLRAATGDQRLADQIFFHQALAEASRCATDIQDSARLIGQGWFELGPTEPLPDGTPGDFRRDGDALARRFALKRSDESWAVVTRCVYRAVPLGLPLDSEERVIEVASEFVICKDLHNVTGTEFFGFDTYTGLPYPPSAENLRAEALLLLAGDIAWDGNEFTPEEAGGLLR